MGVCAEKNAAIAPTIGRLISRDFLRLDAYNAMEGTKGARTVARRCHPSAVRAVAKVRCNARDRATTEREPRKRRANFAIRRKAAQCCRACGAGFGSCQRGKRDSRLCEARGFRVIEFWHFVASIGRCRGHAAFFTRALLILQ